MNWAKLRKDYNESPVGGTMAFLYEGDNPHRKVSSALIRKGLSPSFDFKVYCKPLLHDKAFHYLGKIPNVDVTEYEFKSYATKFGSLYPSSEVHPNLYEMDQIIPIRSNRVAPSDTLPRIKRLHQVYILRLTGNSCI